MSYTPKISVIIPVYNVARFIKRCATTLFEQTWKEVEYIFVNDATPDNSMEVLQRVIDQYPERRHQVKIVHHEVNKGLPAARNTGFAVATGEYIFHCDSDDYVEPDMLECMLNEAENSGADYVWCDWMLSYDNKERYMKQPDFVTPREALKGMLEGKMKYNVWNKLVKRSLYVENKISFPTGHSMGEDMTMIRLMANATKVAHIAKGLYHYVRSNTEAMTQQFSENHLADIKHNVDETMAYLRDRGCLTDIEEGVFKLNVKLPFLITDNWNSYRRWNEWYPESNKYIKEYKEWPLRTKWLQQMAANRFYLGVWACYQVVHVFLYTILYK